MRRIVASIKTMSSEKQIEQLNKLVQRIEKYAADGVYNSAKHEAILASIDKAEATFNRIIDGYIDTTETPLMQQTRDVSDLQKRLHHAKHDIPFPPVEFASSSRTINTRVAIYSLPT